MMTAKPGMEAAGVMIPIPQYPLYTATIAEYNAHMVGNPGILAKPSHIIILNRSSLEYVRSKAAILSVFAYWLFFHASTFHHRWS